MDKNELHNIYNSNIPTFLHNRDVYLRNNTTRVKVMFKSIIDDWKIMKNIYLSQTNYLLTRK